MFIGVTYLSVIHNLWEIIMPIPSQNPGYAQICLSCAHVGNKQEDSCYCNLNSHDFHFVLTNSPQIDPDVVVRVNARSRINNQEHALGNAPCFTTVTEHRGLINNSMVYPNHLTFNGNILTKSVSLSEIHKLKTKSVGS